MKHTFQVVSCSKKVSFLPSCVEQRSRCLLFHVSLNSVLTPSNHHRISEAFHRTTLFNETCLATHPTHIAAYVPWSSKQSPVCPLCSFSSTPSQEPRPWRPPSVCGLVLAVMTGMIGRDKHLFLTPSFLPTSKRLTKT